MTNGCGNYGLAVIFFVVFIILVCQIFLSLFIAIIVDSFINQSNASNEPVTQMDIEVFVDCWSEFDPKALGHIAATKAIKLIEMLT